MLKGEAKRDYQRRYMKDRRAKLKLNSTLVRPKTLNPVRPTRTIKGIIVSRERAMFPKPEIDADDNVIPDE